MSRFPPVQFARLQQPGFSQWDFWVLTFCYGRICWIIKPYGWYNTYNVLHSIHFVNHQLTWRKCKIMTFKVRCIHREAGRCYKHVTAIYKAAIWTVSHIASSADTENNQHWHNSYDISTDRGGSYYQWVIYWPFGYKLKLRVWWGWGCWPWTIQWTSCTTHHITSIIHSSSSVNMQSRPSQAICL